MLNACCLVCIEFLLQMIFNVHYSPLSFDPSHRYDAEGVYAIRDSRKVLSRERRDPAGQSRTR